jgi:hypothetical protein
MALLKIIFTAAIAPLSLHTSLAQTAKPFLESALYFSGDAEMAFIGPAFSIGPGVSLGKRWSASASYTYFGTHYTDGGQKEIFRTHTIDITPNFHFREIFNPSRGLYIGMGIGWQQRRQTPENNMPQRPSYWTGVYNLGYRFPVKINGAERSLSIDWNATGPYKEKDATGAYLEVFTQFMMGLRLRY